MKREKESTYRILLSRSTIREFKLLKELNHQNIIKIDQIIYNYKCQQFGIVFEYGIYDSLNVL